MAKLTKAQKLDIFRRHLIKIYNVFVDKKDIAGYVYVFMKKSYKELCNEYHLRMSESWDHAYDTWKNKYEVEYKKITGIKIHKDYIEYITTSKKLNISRHQNRNYNDIQNKILTNTKNKIHSDIFDSSGNLINEKANIYLVSKSRTFIGKIRYLALEYGNNRCCFCGRTAEETTLEVDHIIPWSKGGATSIMNSRVVCQECNKGVYHAEQKHADAPVISR